MIAIIPARGGSKRIPRKNIREFNGIPIIGHTIQRTINSQMFSRIFVSTEDSEIAKIAVSYGAQVISRSEPLANDYSTTSDVMKEIAITLENEPNECELLCCIYPVNPFLKVEHISRAFSLIQDEELDFVFTVKPFESSIQRALIRNSDGFSQLINPEFQNSRTQDLPLAYHDAAMFYLGRVESWVRGDSPLTGKSKFIVLDKYESIDIDNEEDWIFAQELVKLRESQPSN